MKRRYSIGKSLPLGFAETYQWLHHIFRQNLQFYLFHVSKAGTSTNSMFIWSRCPHICIS